ncbi:hypothetical protein EJD97_021012, partial [Solanum chilense]
GMRAHPLSLKTKFGGIDSNFSEQQQHIPNSAMKELRRLPHEVEIHPGVTKIVVRKGNGDGDEDEKLDVDAWRYRLPSSNMPELATTVYVDGELVVTVPEDDHGRGVFDSGSRGVCRDADQLIFVQ